MVIMRLNRVIVKKTKSKIVRSVREHYLRDDLVCGSSLCVNCVQAKTPLEREPASHSSLCTVPHYIVPDTNVVLHQIDVLGEPVFTNVVILQTVLQELRHRHSPAYNKVKEVLGNADRHFYTFVNEHHKDTFVEREPGESANDRNDRAIRTAAKWYQDHLSFIKKGTCNIKVILLTNDRANAEKARKEGIEVYTFFDYVKSLRKCPYLVDKLAQISSPSEGDIVDSKDGYLFPQHMPLSKIQDYIKGGRLHQGKFQLSRENYLEGCVFIGEDESQEKSVLIQGHRNMNRAVHGDIVAVRILPEEEWPYTSSLVLQDNTKYAEENKADEEPVSKKKQCKVTTGVVVGILKRNWRAYCGILQPPCIKEATLYLFVPSERRIPKVRIETRQGKDLLSKRVVVSIDRWTRDSRYPQGHFVSAIGDVGDKDTENKVLLLEHDIPHQQFSKAVLDCLPQLPWVITNKDVKERQDLRNLSIYSIVHPGCTNIEDALHCRRLGNGLLEVGVHIADVSHFVRQGTAIDKEAKMRAITVYLVDRRIDMVPDLLCSNLCSLIGNEDRFAFTVIWEMNDEAQILRKSFVKSIIRSKATLTYADAQMKIDDKSQNDYPAISLRLLNKLAKILKRKRVENGALSLVSAEVRFPVDTERHDSIDLEKKVKETNSMVEEFMLLANISVAERILESLPDCALLRRHPAPPQANFEPLIKAAKSRGFSMDVRTNKTLAESLDAAVLSDNPYFNVMLRMVATRCMAQALYFSSGMLPLSDYFHYGIAVPIYTHFTSPVRRYSDIIVHRLLAVAIGADVAYPSLVDKEKTQEICNNLNYRHKQAQYCSRASVNLYTYIFFKEKTVQEEGYILFVKENALQVLLPRFGLEGSLYVSSKNKENDAVHFVFDEKVPSLTAANVVLRQFDPVIVQLRIDKDNVQHQNVVLQLVKPEIPGFNVVSKEEDEPPRKRQKLNI